MEPKTAIFTLTSALHDEQAISAVSEEFLTSLGIEYIFMDSNYADYGRYDLNLIYVRTGGTEGIFKRLLPKLLEQSQSPFYLLTSGKSNSLAASMEILFFLRQNNIGGEIIHGSTEYMTRRIQLLAKVEAARKALGNSKLGIIGEPSDWLISSVVDKENIKQKLGIQLIDVHMQELLEEVGVTPLRECKLDTSNKIVRKSLPGALQIYDALKKIVGRYHLQGLTIRCFDLLSAVHNTGCMALALLNSEGIVAGCEGDIPAMLSMKIAQTLVGKSGFQANPASINVETGEMLFAHCTIPFNMVERYELDTHFESGIGVGIRGYMKEGPITIFKIAGNLQRYFIAEGTLLESQAKPNLCRTQQVIRLNNPSQANYFLTNPIGNHHIILPGHHKELLEEMVSKFL